MGWMVVAYRDAPVDAPLWRVGGVTLTVVAVAMLFASVLLAGPLIKNPSFPTLGERLARTGPARGVYAVTRHPMMWSFAIWGLTHATTYPISQNLVVTTALVILSLVGARLQDVKKERLQPESWAAWERQTSFLPFAAIIDGRARMAT
jgi:uncharacterized membrane protein